MLYGHKTPMITNPQYNSVYTSIFPIVVPLRFGLRCGMSVQVIENGMQVMKKCVRLRGSMGSCGVALTNRPLRTEEVFQIEILAMNFFVRSDPPTGMAFGITTITDLPVFMRRRTIGTWMLDWGGHKEHVVVVNGKDVEQDVVSADDLRSLKSANLILRHVPPEEAQYESDLIDTGVKVTPGDRVALHVTQKRELVFSINGEEKGVVATGIPEGVYGFVELLNESYVELVPDDKSLLMNATYVYPYIF